MSDPSELAALSSDANATAMQAAEWIQRRAFWSWSSDDQAALDAWLNQSLAHRIAYTRVEAAWNRSARVTVLRSSGETRNSSAQYGTSAIWRRASVAAILVLIAVTGVVWWEYRGAGNEATYKTAIGERRAVKLADGSSIELNTNTILIASVSASQRSIKLVGGEAFFDVKHDAKRPFTVTIGSHRVTDLGTKFLVRSEPNHLEVALLEGSAAFGEADERSSPIVLAPGDYLTFSNNQIRTRKAPSRALADELSWRRGMLVFENATLQDAADEINRYNGTKIVVADQAAAQLRISAAFRTTHVEDFVQMAQVLLNLRVERRGEEVIVSR